MRMFICKQINSNLMIKGIACFLGLLFWLSYNHKQSIRCWLNIPVSFYNTDHNKITATPEHITIQIQGTRSDIYSLNIESLACHIDAHRLTKGSHDLSIPSEKLFLPETINVVNYMPSLINIQIE